MLRESGGRIAITLTNQPNTQCRFDQSMTAQWCVGGLLAIFGTRGLGQRY
jgi:hypothetical protein